MHPVSWSLYIPAASQGLRSRLRRTPFTPLTVGMKNPRGPTPSGIHTRLICFPWSRCARSTCANVRFFLKPLKNFMPRIQQHFGHPLPVVRSLALRTPKGSRQQIIYFIGVFRYLRDLNLRETVNSQGESADENDAYSTPPPPLRGWLRIFTRVGPLKGTIDLKPCDFSA